MNLLNLFNIYLIIYSYIYLFIYNIYFFIFNIYSFIFLFIYLLIYLFIYLFSSEQQVIDHFKSLQLRLAHATFIYNY